MNTLLTADLHLTSNPRDTDRWNLFPWIEEQILKHKISDIAILGDLCDAKDKHDQELVNKVINVLTSLAKKARVIVLKGNHDFIIEQAPYFRFLNKLDNITFINKPTGIELGVGNSLFLPCTKNGDWGPKITSAYCKRFDYIFTHQTYDGCTSENGTKLTGIPPTIFKWFKGKVWSGDIHVQQKVGKNIEYVGAPYPIRFGDVYTPRLVLLTNNNHKDLHFPHRIKKLIEVSSVSEIEELNLPPNSQVKIRVKLKRSEFANWENMRKQITEIVAQKKLDLCGLELERTYNKQETFNIEKGAVTTTDTIVEEYAKHKKLGGKTTQVGLDLLKEAKQ